MPKTGKGDSRSAREPIMLVRLAGTTFVAIMCLMAQAAVAAPFSEEQKSELLAAHNKYRAEISEKPLAWSDSLADGAQIWAQHLAEEVLTLQHSGDAGVGENLAMWSAGRA